MKGPRLRARRKLGLVKYCTTVNRAGFLFRRKLTELVESRYPLSSGLTSADDYDDQSHKHTHKFCGLKHFHRRS